MLAIARRFQAPLTFRAAGTSLSGQALGPGILVKLGHGKRRSRGEQGQDQESHDSMTS